MPDGPDSANTGYVARDTTDPTALILMRHRHGQHAGRRRDPACPDCSPLTAAAAAKTAKLSRDLEGIQSDSPASRPSKNGQANGKAARSSSLPRSVIEKPMQTALAIESAMKRDLGTWWGHVAAREFDAILPKVEQYGATDLRVLGAAMRSMAPQASSDVSDEELAIAFYAFGKLSRIMGAIADGRCPSDDCWHDLAVYAKMAQRVRETGNWP